MDQKTGIGSLYYEFFRGYEAENSLTCHDFRSNSTYKPAYTPRLRSPQASLPDRMRASFGGPAYEPQRSGVFCGRGEYHGEGTDAYQDDDARGRGAGSHPRDSRSLGRCRLPGRIRLRVRPDVAWRSADRRLIRQPADEHQPR